MSAYTNNNKTYAFCQYKGLAAVYTRGVSTKSISQDQGYVAGVCNINREEIAQRRKAGYIGLVLFVVVLGVFLLLHLNRWARIGLFFPAFLAAIGFLQAKEHFCVGYGAAGQHNATEGSTTAHAVTNKAEAQKDKRRARQLNLKAMRFSVAATVLALVIPV